MPTVLFLAVPYLFFSVVWVIKPNRVRSIVAFAVFAAGGLYVLYRDRAAERGHGLRPDRRRCHRPPSGSRKIPPGEGKRGRIKQGKAGKNAFEKVTKDPSDGRCRAGSAFDDPRCRAGDDGRPEAEPGRGGRGRLSVSADRAHVPFVHSGAAGRGLRAAAGFLAGPAVSVSPGGGRKGGRVPAERFSGRA